MHRITFPLLIEDFISKERTTFRYNKITIDFAIGRRDGKISTLFKAERKEKYWEEQKERYKSKE